MFLILLVFSLDLRVCRLGFIKVAIRQGSVVSLLQIVSFNLFFFAVLIWFLCSRLGKMMLVLGRVVSAVAEALISCGL